MLVSRWLQSSKGGEAKLTKFLWRNGFPWARAMSLSCGENAEGGAGKGGDKCRKTRAINSYASEW